MQKANLTWYTFLDLSEFLITRGLLSVQYHYDALDTYALPSLMLRPNGTTPAFPTEGGKSARRWYVCTPKGCETLDKLSLVLGDLRSSALLVQN